MSEWMDETPISADDIEEMLETYHIGKKPLSLLLGWGETTIIRYMDKEIATKEYSQRLRVLKQNSFLYYQLLEHNKGAITPVAYRKSKRAVLGYLFQRKIMCFACYLIHLFEGDITPKYLNFLLYFAQGFSLALFGLELFEEDLRHSLKQQIPYLEFYEEMKQNRIHDIEEVEGYLGENEKLIAYHIYKAFSWYGTRTLSTIVDQDFKRIRSNCEEKKFSHISKEELQEYYCMIVKEYNIRSIHDISKYPLHLLDQLIQE